MTAIEGNASGVDWAARNGLDQTGASSASLHRRPLSLSRDRVADAPPALCAALPDAPPAILAALYERNAPQHAYLLVDGTLRAQVAGLFDLDVIDAPARSLFDGDSSEEAGPWLVDLSIRDADAPRNIRGLRDFFARHRAAGFSVLISTDVPFDPLRSHLRRFTRLPVLEDGRVLTFRFWDPRVLDPFLQAISADRSRLRRMTMKDAGQMIAYVLPPTDAADGTASHVAPAPDLSA